MKLIVRRAAGISKTIEFEIPNGTPIHISDLPYAWFIIRKDIVQYTVTSPFKAEFVNGTISIWKSDN